jgi:hypothetical protein
MYSSLFYWAIAKSSVGHPDPQDPRVFVPSGARICKRLLSPGIDSEKSILPAYVACRAGTTNRVVVPARQPENRFLVKGLQIRALI